MLVRAKVAPIRIAACSPFFATIGCGTRLKAVFPKEEALWLNKHKCGPVLLVILSSLKYLACQGHRLLAESR